MKILVINAGSSSLKYQLFDMENGTVLARGLCEKIGLSGAITHKRPGKETYATEHPMPTHNEAIALVLKLLTDPELGVITSVDEISAVGHRFAHGGKITKSCVLGEEELKYIESIIPINPLHGPPALKGVAACKAIMPDKTMVGVFDLPPAPGHGGSLHDASCEGFAASPFFQRPVPPPSAPGSRAGAADTAIAKPWLP